MMKNMVVLALLSTAPLQACAQEHPVGWQAAVGIVAQVRDGRWCLATADSSLVSGDTLSAVAIPVGPGTSSSGPDAFRVTGVHPGICAPLWGAFGETDYELEPGSPEPRSPSVTVRGAGAKLIVTDSAIQADLDGDGKFETFRVCTSYEGLHLTLWDGPPLQSARLWHRYFALGYDVEPSCTEADYAEPH